MYEIKQSLIIGCLLVSRYQVHMKMKDGLSCRFSVVLHQIEPVTVQAGKQTACNFFCHRQYLCPDLIRQFEQTDGVVTVERL